MLNVAYLRNELRMIGVDIADRHVLSLLHYRYSR